MAYAKITFEHPEIGTVRQAPGGFSWSLFWLGPIVPIYRKDWVPLLVMLALAGLTSGFAALFFPFFYNRFYIKGLLKKGYKVTAVEGADIATLRKKLELALPEK